MKTEIRKFREKSGMTQEQLAEKVNVARQTILFLEKGQYNPSLRLAFGISKVLKVPVERLFSFDDE